MGVHFLNLEYIFLRVYELITGVQVDYSQVPSALFFWWEFLTIAGLIIAFVFLILLTYVRIRLLQVEHHGFHLREEQEHAHEAHVAHAQAPKNLRWAVVVDLAASPTESDWRRAIMEADIILAALLAERGYVGATIADQLKNANPLQFTTLDLAWEAHRMRNALAHLGEAFPLSQRDARATIDLYRRVFEEFNYI